MGGGMLSIFLFVFALAAVPGMLGEDQSQNQMVRTDYEPCCHHHQCVVIIWYGHESDYWEGYCKDDYKKHNNNGGWNSGSDQQHYSYCGLNHNYCYYTGECYYRYKNGTVVDKSVRLADVDINDIPRGRRRAAEVSNE